MANRKVLINRHTTGNTAPNAAEMFHGEIAVAHETGKETLFTKNNANEMVPFISCAQTISIIDSKISGAAVSYDVKSGEDEAFIAVATAKTGSAVTFTVTSDDIMSEDAFEAYSAETKTRIDTNYSAITDLTAVVSALTNVVVTGISGDTIIVAEVKNPSTGTNYVALTHREGAEVSGFKKLSTDAYGHVTASTDVVTADIQALGFKTSAETGEDLAALSASVVANETKIEALSGATEAISGFAATQIAALSAGTLQLSADTDAAIAALSGNAESKINELSAGTIALVGASAASVFSSAKTYTDEQIDKVYASGASLIAEEIAKLDSETAVTAGKYLTGIAIADGKISGITEADLPTLTSVKTGTGNVVSDIAVNGHEISFSTVSVATSVQIDALSSATQAFSAATDAKFAELSAYTEDVDDKVKALSAGTIQLSADTKATIEQLSAGTIAVSGYAHGEIVELSGATVSAFTAILGMDKAADAVAGQVVTTVSEVDGVVSETKANVKDLQLGGYVKDTTATGDIAETDTINAALSKLENKAAAITIANADGSINVTTGATGTDINVNIKSGEKVLAKDGNAGLYTDLDLVKITTGLPAEIKERYQLLATDDSQIGVNIDVPKDSHIVSINYITEGEHAQNLEYVYIDASGNTQTTYVDMSSLVIESEFKSGVTATNGIVHGVVDSTSESFLTVGGDGFKLSGVQDAINAAVEALDVTGDTAVAGQYVAAIEETDGVVAVKTRANVSEAVLNNYAKGSDATAVASTDTVNQAISKLENQVDAAKAAATTKVVEGTDAGNNMTITPSTSATDGSVTYTIDLADVASATALTAEIAARKAVDGQNGDTYAANTNANFISNATSLNDADVKLDAAIKALSGDVVDYVDGQIDEVYASGVSYTDAKVAAEIALLDSSTAVTAGKYITGIAIADGKISGITEESLPANVAISATTATPVDTASAVLTGVTASGVDNHELTFGMSNKVFSAETSNSALTSESALTADSAEKVANALSISGYSTSSAASLDSAIAFDGSKAKSLTFGTNGPAGLKSMSMTSAGLVDVEVIDCGEY